MLAHKQNLIRLGKSQLSKRGIYVCQNANQIKQLFRTVVRDPFDLFIVKNLYTIRILADPGDESLFD